ncbi:hypothetical protein B0H13DRAFT_1621903, partial [Mycena leptocephala]
ADIIHRDLNPGKLLLNANCTLKVCDFGLARSVQTTTAEEAGVMTEYVVSTLKIGDTTAVQACQPAMDDFSDAVGGSTRKIGMHNISVPLGARDISTLIGNHSDTMSRMDIDSTLTERDGRGKQGLLLPFI